MKNKKSNLQGMTKSLWYEDIQLFAEKINVAFQAVSGDNIEPLTPDDCFTTCADTQEPIHDHYIISVSQVESSLKRSLSKCQSDQTTSQTGSCMNLHPGCLHPNAESFRESYIPRLWKSANVCPLPKVQPPMRVVKDLRPISWTPMLCKGLEWYARDFILDVIENFCDTHQFGQEQLNSASNCEACTLLVAALEFSYWISGKYLIGLTPKSSYLNWEMQDQMSWVICCHVKANI